MNIKKLNEELEKVLNEWTNYEEHVEVESQAEQLFPWCAQPGMIIAAYNDSPKKKTAALGYIDFEDAEHERFAISIFSDHVWLNYTNRSMKKWEEIASIKIDNITADEIESPKALDLLKLVKPYIDKKYEEIQQRKQNGDVESDDYEDDEDEYYEDEEYEQELYDFISTLPTALKRKLGKKFEAHQTDNTVYINYDKKPENTVFVEPMEHSTQVLKIGLLDDTNDEIDYQELDLEDFGKNDITNIVDVVKELFGTVE